jgi:DNA repair protein RecN (Recombination protein N)
MLRRLSVANFAVAERIELELGAGFTALTGETGAGKSILLEALGFLLGARGSSSCLRTGAASLSVEGAFDAADFPADLRARFALPAAGAVVARRELDVGGRTRAFLAGKPAPVAALARLGEAFADFHGQHENQTLLRESVQLELLDRFGGLEAERAKAGELHARWTALKSRLEASSMSEAERERRVDLLAVQLDDIDALKLREGEEEELDEKLPRLKNAERLRASAEAACLALDGDEGAALPLLARAEKALAELSRLDPSAERLRAELESARLSAEAVAREAEGYRSGLSADPDALDALLSRQDQLARLKKKLGAATLSEALAARERMAAELDALRNSDARLEETRRELERAEKELAAHAEALHEARVKAAKKLDAAVLKELKVLGLPHARFAACVEMEEGAWGATGADAAQFLLAPNPGEPPRPLKTAASGGELSRVMLALKAAFARADRTPLLVFDEVDAGIGGEVARAVGERLAAIARGRQVLCVTHLPQVACFAKEHHHLTKEVASGRTRVKAERLEGAARLETVARMLGGRGATPASRKHAQELLESSLT